VQGESTVRPGKQVRMTFNGLKWNAMTNMAETSVTDFFTLFGRVSGSTSVWTRPCLKSGRVVTHGPGGNHHHRDIETFVTRLLQLKTNTSATYATLKYIKIDKR